MPDPLTRAAAKTSTEGGGPFLSLVSTLLGTVTDAEDLSQETWLSWPSAPPPR
ncbi:hypothetical protein [Streptomyces sp. NPDC058295]|uniref:hypothetical protein n=1 Tax=Streptomyces sp. NPDC058295 TaxID=3346431 RepID=UPI0036E3835D